MSLSAALDDILEDANKKVAQENPTILPIFDSPFKLNLAFASESALAKFENIVSLLNGKNLLQTMTRVDKAFAMEMFAMLPEEAYRNNGKLTSSPSVINKNLIGDAVKNADDNVPEEIIASIKSFKDELDNNLEHIQYTVTALNDYVGMMTERMEQFKKVEPIVVYDGKNVSLINTSISDLSYYSDEIYGYPKYDGKLSVMFRDIFLEPTFRTYTDFNRPKEPDEAVVQICSMSLSELYEDIRQLSNRISNQVPSMIHYKETAASLINAGPLKVEDADVARIVRELNFNLMNLTFIKMVYDIIITPDNFIDRVTALLRFID